MRRIFLTLFFCLITYSAQAQFASDTFTDTNGTLLTLHTSTSGHSWSQTAGAIITIQSNKAQTNSTLATTIQTAIISATPPTADYSVEVTCRLSVITNSNNYCGGLVRKQSGAETYYSYSIRGGTASNRKTVLEEVTAGSRADLFVDTDADLTADTDYVLKIEIRGSEIKVYKDTVLKTTTTDASISTTGSAGIVMRMSSATQTADADTFTATDLSVAGGEVIIISDLIQQMNRRNV